MLVGISTDPQDKASEKSTGKSTSKNTDKHNTPPKPPPDDQSKEKKQDGCSHKDKSGVTRTNGSLAQGSTHSHTQHGLLGGVLSGSLTWKGRWESTGPTIESLPVWELA